MRVPIIFLLCRNVDAEPLGTKPNESSKQLSTQNKDNYDMRSHWLQMKECYIRL